MGSGGSAGAWGRQTVPALRREPGMDADACLSGSAVRGTAADRGTMVVDVTYLCNATCRYCRWGDKNTPGRAAQDLADVLIPPDTLEMVGTRRVVISGGEPRLHPRISDILAHYGSLVDEVVVITNGYGLDAKAAGSLLDAGATGITISLDSVDAMESFMTRRTPPHIHGEILRNMEGMAAGRRFELGINSTVTSVTSNWITVEGLLLLGSRLDLDFVKFQPIFDDGYASANSPDLMLGADDAALLLDVASRLETVAHPPTNPPEFWADVAELAGGGMLPPAGCTLGSSDAISTGGRLSMCYWVASSRYGRLDRPGYDAAASRFTEDKQRCRVGFHCFCNQGLGHAWRTDRTG